MLAVWNCIYHVENVTLTHSLAWNYTMLSPTIWWCFSPLCFKSVCSIGLQMPSLSLPESDAWNNLSKKVPTIFLFPLIELTFNYKLIFLFNYRSIWWNNGWQSPTAIIQSLCPDYVAGSYALGSKILLYSKETHGNQSNSKAKKRGGVDKALAILWS